MTPDIVGCEKGKIITADNGHSVSQIMAYAGAGGCDISPDKT